MAYRCSFLDNEEYSAQDVNNVFACLTSGGVVFSDNGNIMSDLNEAMAAMVESGVISDATACKVVRDEGGYKILPGACFMDDGAVIIFTEAEVLSVPDGVMSYVYLLRNPVMNSIDIVVSGVAGNEKSVSLAEIDERGNVFDRRRYAKSKVMLGVGNTLRNVSVEFVDCNFDTSETVVADIGSGDFSYIVIWDGTYEGPTGKIEQRVAGLKNLKQLVEGEYINLVIGQYDGETKEFLYAKKDGQYLHLRLANTFENAKYALNLAVI